MVQQKEGIKGITPEKQLQYKEAKSRKDASERRKRKAEKKEGKTQDRLLAFLDNMITACGYNHRTFAELTGTTPQAIYWIFSVKDDCDLTKVEEILGALGYGVRLELRESKNAQGAPKKLEKTTFQALDVSISIEGDVFTKGASRTNNYPTPEYIKNYPKEGRLKAIADIFNAGNHTLKEFSALTGIPSYTLRLIFTRNDIQVSKIAAIARTMGFEIVWRLAKR